MKRWPIIRHLRWLVLAYRMEQQERRWRSLGLLPINRTVEYEMLERVWHGEDDDE